MNSDRDQSAMTTSHSIGIVGGSGALGGAIARALLLDGLSHGGLREVNPLRCAANAA
jgi:hypothetical protein